MKELIVAAAVESIETVTAFVEGLLEELDCPMKAQMQISIAIDELFGNIAHYAYPSGEGEAVVRFEAAEDMKSVVITFIDQGVPYNPLTAEEPDITLSAEDRRPGGLGIFMVRKSMDEMSYRYENGSNILSIRKNLRS